MKIKIALTGLLISVIFNTYIYSQKTTTTEPQIQNPYLSNTQMNSNFKINADAPDILNSFNQQNVQNTQLKTVIIDKAVNKDKYIVGPNDVFTLGIYGFLNQQLPVTVNVEGSVVIPTVGEVKVDGLTLSEAKNKVISAVKKRYYSSEISFVLSTPKTFLITVSSIIQRKIEVNSMNRVSDIMNYVYYDTTNVTRAQYTFNNKTEFFQPAVSLRNIEIYHKDGSMSKVDLYNYFITNKDEYNPYLIEGDFVKIPLGQLDKNYVTISGAVQLPGVYEYNTLDVLESVIGLSRGFDATAQQDSIILFRTNPETKKFESHYLKYDDDKSFKVNNYDRIFVKYRGDVIQNYSITVLGEVNMPGIYPISQKNTRLKDVIEMAGGFKNTAYLPLSIVFRRYDQEYLKRDTNEILINMRTNDLIVNEKDKLSFERDVISRRNRMVVDFEKLFKENDSTQNIIIEDKDVIYINDDKKVVYVYGQVSNEGYVPYKEGANYEYYIEKAGGYSLAADKGDTRVIKFNSRGWYKVDETKVMSGDFIYVPKRTPQEFTQSFSIFATTVGIVASLITTYLLIKQQSK